MKKCKNPECGKEIPDNLNYCNQDCIKRHIEIKKEQKQQEPLKLKSEETHWLGQDRRKRAMETILKLAEELCPISYKHFACTVSYRTGLSLRKITDNYLEVLLELGLLKRDENELFLGEVES